MWRAISPGMVRSLHSSGSLCTLIYFLSSHAFSASQIPQFLRLQFADFLHFPSLFCEHLVKFAEKKPAGGCKLFSAVPSLGTSPFLASVHSASFCRVHPLRSWTFLLSCYILEMQKTQSSSEWRRERKEGGREGGRREGKERDGEREIFLISFC